MAARAEGVAPGLRIAPGESRSVEPDAGGQVQDREADLPRLRGGPILKLASFSTFFQSPPAETLLVLANAYSLRPALLACAYLSPRGALLPRNVVRVSWWLPRAFLRLACFAWCA